MKPNLAALRLKLEAYVHRHGGSIVCSDELHDPAAGYVYGWEHGFDIELPTDDLVRQHEQSLGMSIEEVKIRLMIQGIITLSLGPHPHSGDEVAAKICLTSKKSAAQLARYATPVTAEDLRKGQWISEFLASPLAERFTADWVAKTARDLDVTDGAVALLILAKQRQNTERLCRFKHNGFRRYGPFGRAFFESHEQTISV